MLSRSKITRARRLIGGCSNYFLVDIRTSYIDCDQLKVVWTGRSQNL